MVGERFRKTGCPSDPESFSDDFFDVAEVNQGRCFEESGQRLENVD